MFHRNPATSWKQPQPGCRGFFRGVLGFAPTCFAVFTPMKKEHTRNKVLKADSYENRCPGVLRAERAEMLGTSAQRDREKASGNQPEKLRGE
jgi:hypothetical protein